MMRNPFTVCRVVPSFHAEGTLQKLFGWRHGSSKAICPTAIFRYKPARIANAEELTDAELVSEELTVQLLPPSRDDADVREKNTNDGPAARARVDGYPVPVRWKQQGRIGLAGKSACVACVSWCSRYPSSSVHGRHCDNVLSNSMSAARNFSTCRCPTPPARSLAP